MATELELALLSYRVYGQSFENKVPMPSWSEDLSRDLGSGFAASIYTKGSKAVVAFRGTDAPQLLDFWTGNIPAALGMHSTQVAEAIELVADAIFLYGRENISFTGHSLGGGLASLMAVFFDLPATVFDPAPFGLTAQGKFVPLMPIFPYFLPPLPSPVIGQYFEEYTDYQISMNRNGPPDASFEAYSIAFKLLGGYSAEEREVLYTQRAGEVSGAYLQGEILTLLRSMLPTAALPGSMRPVSIGNTTLNDQPLLTPEGAIDGTALHSMALLVAMIASPSLRSASMELPKLLEMMMDDELYASPDDSDEINFLNRLLQGQVEDGVSTPEGAIDRFAQDLLTLAGTSGLARSNTSIRDALIVAAIEYHNFRPSETASYLFTLSRGGIHFRYSDMEANISQLKSQPKLAEATALLMGSTDPQLAQRLEEGTAWHIQIGEDSLLWRAPDDENENDVALGGVRSDGLSGGAGDDVLFGGLGIDALEGGSGDDWLYGGLDDDFLYGGAGYDTYVYNVGGGKDTIDDEDDSGVVQFQGVALTGANAIRDIDVSTQSLQWLWTEGGQTFIATMLDGNVQTGGTLSIASNASSSISDRVVIRNYVSGDLGINLTMGDLGQGLQAGPVGIATDSHGWTYLEVDSGIVVRQPDGDKAIVQNSPDGSNPIVLPASIGFEPPEGTGPSYVAGWTTNGVGSPIAMLTYRLTATNLYGTYYSVSRADPLLEPSWDLYYLSPSTEGQYSTGPEQIDISNSYSVLMASNGGYPWQAATGHLGDDHITGSAIRDYLVDDFARTSNDQQTAFGTTFTGTSTLDAFGNDVLLGYGGDDWIETHGGDDIVFGGADNDVIIDTPVANGDYAYSTAWVDMPGHTNRDTLFGEGGNDVIIAGAGEALIDGGEGNDELFGGADDDILNGGNGNDILSGDTQQAAMLRQGPDPSDSQGYYSRYLILPDEMGIVPRTPESAIMSSSLWQSYAAHSSGAYFSNTLPRQGNDILNGGAGDDILIGGGGNDILSGGENNDLLQGDLLFIPANSQNLLFSDASATPLAMHGDDFLSGGEGNDELYGGGGNDRLHGDGGNDTLYGGDGADSLYGGAGNDILYGDAFDLVLDGGAGADQIFGDIGDDQIVISEGGDSVSGGAGNDTYLIDAGVGAATINDAAGATAFRFGRSMSLSTLTLSQSNGTAHMDFGNGDTLSLSLDTLFRVSELEFQDVGETLSLSAVIEQSYHPTTLGNPATDPNYNSVLLGAGVVIGDVGLLGYNQDLLLTYDGAIENWVDVDNLISRGALVSAQDGADYGLAVGTQVLVLHNWFISQQFDYLGVLRDSQSGTRNIATEAVESTPHHFVGTQSDDAIVGLATNDLLVGLDGDDVLDGNEGGDDLEGGSGNDTYIWNAGDGLDTIQELSGYDTISFGSGIAPGDVTLTELASGLRITVGEPASNQGILISNQIGNGVQVQPIETIEFNDGTSWTASDIDSLIVGNRRPRLLVPMEGQALRPGQYSSVDIPPGSFVDPNAGDSLTFGATLIDGSPLPPWLSIDPLTGSLSGYRPTFDSASYAVRLTATDSAGLSVASDFDVVAYFNLQTGTQDAETLTGGNLGDTLLGLAGDDALAGNDGNDELIAGDGHDQLSGDIGDDTLDGGRGEDALSGGLGDDALNGGADSDRYVFDANFGHDVISDSSGEDVIEFIANSSIEFSDLVVTQQGNDLSIVQGSNSITVRDWYTSTSNRIERVIVNEGGGQTTYFAAQLNALANGTDIAPIYTGVQDVLEVQPGTTVSYQLQGFSDVGAPGPLTYVAYNLPEWLQFDPVTLTFSGTVPNPIITSWSPYVTAIDSAGLVSIGASVSIYERVARTPIAGTAGNDVITGGASADFISGLDGNDTLDGGAGTYNRLYGGAGNDILYLRGSGDDADGGDGDDQIEVLGLSNEVHGGAGNDFINNANWAFGDTGNDHIVGSNSGSDTLFGGSGDDVIDGRSGDDNIDGDEGDDVLLGGNGNDHMDGESGNDSLNGGNGNDALNGDIGNDTYTGFTGSSGTDMIWETGGYDVLEFSPTVNLTLSALTFVRYSYDTSSTPNPSGANLRITLGSNLRIDIPYQYGYAFQAPEMGTVEEFVLYNQGLRYAYTNAQVHGLVSGINAGPTVNERSASQAVAIGSAYQLQIAANAFTDAESQTSLQYSATLASGAALPTWLTFNPLTKTLSGTPTVGQEGLLQVRIHAADSGGLTAYYDVALLVGGAQVSGGANSDQLQAMQQDTFVQGGAGDDFLVGAAGNDFLSGDAGNDVIEGRGGSDTLSGGLGDDVYVVRDSLHSIIENQNAGNDEVLSTISYTLGDNVERLTLLGDAALNATGNAANNTLTGNSAANHLDGAAGQDVMIGGLGDDTYVIQGGDQVTEGLDGGFDTAESNQSWSLPDNVDRLILTGSAEIYGIGNSSDNVITGNSAANTLDGGEGVDVLVGGTGDDTYVVDNVGDQVTEGVNEGTDQVISTVSFTLGANFETLILDGTDAISGYGNSLSNVIFGNLGDNLLDGNGGDDEFAGDVGNDIYVVDSSSDIVSEYSGEGIDTVRSSVTWTLGGNLENLVLTGGANITGTGNSLANVITGNSGSNTLNGGSGADSMLGGAGDDTYVVDNAGDVITENSNEGIDLVQSSVTYTLSSNVENLTLTGSSGLNGTGNSLDNVLNGNSGNNTLTGGDGHDTLNGGSGSDTMRGGLGNDTYVVAQTGDVVTENAGEGTDLVQSSISYTLGTEVENLTLTNTGTTVITGTGNGSANVLIGSSGSNTLVGNGGNDTLDAGSAGTDILRGGTGDDTYILTRSSGVTITENASEGIDLVQSSVTHTLASNVEQLFLTGTTAINGTGNTLANLLRGNGVNNTLAGGGGTDILEGGAGNDILSNTSGNTLLNGGADTDTLTGTGNNDLLIGGTGNDALTTGTGADIIAFNLGDGQDTVAVSTTRDNVVSIGGGAVYADLVFEKSGNNLILRVGATSQITFTNYYSTTANRSVNTLQVIIEGTSDYSPGSGNATRDQKIERFNFEGLVAAFDAARVANPSLTTWALTNGLAANVVGGSDTQAIGGELTYRYGRVGNLSDVAFSDATSILSSASFGTGLQTLLTQSGSGMRLLSLPDQPAATDTALMTDVDLLFADSTATEVTDTRMQNHGLLSDEAAVETDPSSLMGTAELFGNEIVCFDEERVPIKLWMHTVTDVDLVRGTVKLPLWDWSQPQIKDYLGVDRDVLGDESFIPEIHIDSFAGGVLSAPTSNVALRRGDRRVKEHAHW